MRRTSPRLALALVALLGCAEQRDEGRAEPTMVTSTQGGSKGESHTAPDSTPTTSPDASAEVGVAEPDSVESSAAAPDGKDAEIERALALIRDSGLYFFAPDDEAPDDIAAATEYTSHQFASMLETKWSWIGYDLHELDPWLTEIATRSFKSNLPYEVRTADGQLREVGPWLREQLATTSTMKTPP